MFDDIQARYKEFLKQIESDSKVYMQILNPRREDYENRKEYYWLVQSLNILMNYFNIVQVRVALLALLKTKEKQLISTAKFKSTIIFLENFHFAYNSVTAGNSNRFENIYSKFAIGLNKCNAKEQVIENIDENLIVPLTNLFPDFQRFSKGFAELTFSKKDHPNNVKTKYAINKLNAYYEGQEVFSDNGTIEHIQSEKQSAESLKIGNLILLEQRLNNDGEDKSYLNKKKTYLRSSYKWIKIFVADHDDWKEKDIAARSIDLAKIYYTEILQREIKQE